MSKQKTIMSPETRNQAVALMNEYLQIYRNKEDFNQRIKEEKDAYEKGLKETGAKLIEIGNEHKDLFVDGNLNITDVGYLHLVTSATAKVGSKFDFKAFAKKFPKLFDLKKAFNIKPLQKAFLNNDTRKDLQQHGVSLTTGSDKIQVKVRGAAEEETEPNQE
jgi:hypothetical protein